LFLILLMDQSKIQIDWDSCGTFLVFSENDANVLLRDYRIVCSSTSGVTDDLKKFPPMVLLPEQVQVLLENGFAQVRRIRNSFVGEFEGPIKVATKTNITEEYLSELARKIYSGRKAKRRNMITTNDNNHSASKIQKVETIYDENKMDQEIQLIVKDLKSREENMQETRLVSFCPSSTAYEFVDEPTFPNNLGYLRKVATFRDLWRKGFYLTSGTKFGCDYLAYEKSPDTEHARFMVISWNSNVSSISLTDLIGFTRVASQVKKKIIFSIVGEGSVVPHYIEINWWKGDDL